MYINFVLDVHSPLEGCMSPLGSHKHLSDAPEDALRVIIMRQSEAQNRPLSYLWVHVAVPPGSLFKASWVPLPSGPLEGDVELLGAIAAVSGGYWASHRPSWAGLWPYEVLPRGCLRTIFGSSGKPPGSPGRCLERPGGHLDFSGVANQT